MTLSTLVMTTSLALFVTLAVGCGADSHDAETSGDIHAPEVLFASPSFVGVDQYGESFSSESLRGHIWVASFMFTTCQTVCPDLNAKQRVLQSEFAERGVRFVSISTDPDTDSPETLRSYANDYDAKPGVWLFLHMSIDSVRSLSTQGFKLMDPETPEMHSTRFVLVDAAGNIRGFYDSEDQTRLDALRSDILQLLSEVAS